MTRSKGVGRAMRRGLVLAFAFMTRIPMPRLKDFSPDELDHSAVYFPLVGTVIGAVVALPLYTLHGRPWFAAWLSLLIWVWMTGALHLDGLGDVADAFGAAHRNPDRFFEVLKDPHTGLFGVVAVSMQLVTKLVLLGQLSDNHVAWGIVLTPAWARWLTILCSRTIPQLPASSGERFTWPISWISILGWAIVLTAFASWLAPSTLVTLPLTLLVTLYWRRRLGGISGDGFGATIEVVESLLLCTLVLARGGLT